MPWQRRQIPKWQRYVQIYLLALGLILVLVLIFVVITFAAWYLAGGHRG